MSYHHWYLRGQQAQSEYQEFNKEKTKERDLRPGRDTALGSTGVALSHAGSESREGTVEDRAVGGGEGFGDGLAEHGGWLVVTIDCVYMRKGDENGLKRRWKRYSKGKPVVKLAPELVYSYKQVRQWMTQISCDM